MPPGSAHAMPAPREPASDRPPSATAATRRPGAPGSASHRRARTRTGRSTSACNSIRNADIHAAPAHLVRITHPFHPLSGRQLACVGEHFSRYGKRLLLQVDALTVCSVPPQWTDVVAPDPEIAIGDGRALLRLTDFIELARLVARLASMSRHQCQSDQCVSKTTPRV
jgi:hypothetical protein